MRLRTMSSALVLALLVGLTLPTAAAARDLFGYKRGPVHVVDHGSKRQGAAIVHDITYWEPGSAHVDAYLVLPTRGGRHHSAVLFAHWFDPPDPTSTRLEFLDEAVDLASNRVVSLLPQLDFPWAADPTGTETDVHRIVKQVLILRRGLDLLSSRHDVARGRIGIAGHDYGAMYAILAAHADRRIRTGVYMAPDATFVDWFDTFWLQLPAARLAAYTRLLAPYDPILHIRGGALLQFARDDFFIPRTTALRLARAAAPNAFVNFYGGGHELNGVARAQRDLWLGVQLGFLRAPAQR
jgi:dienelactone hydrolase